jgi:drug/metabolite transporter (DMT)-like permease
VRHRRYDGTLGVIGLYLVVVLFWGSTFLWVELATDHTSPFVVSALRMAVGGVVVLSVGALLGPAMRRAHSFTALRPWLARGVVLALLTAAVPSVLLAIAQREISSGTASILNATAPLWTALVTWMAIRGPAGRLAPLQIGGLVLGVLGVGLLANEAPTTAEMKGQMIVVGLAAIYGSGGVYAQRTFGSAPPLTAAIMSTVVGALLALPFGIAGWIADPPTLGAFGAMVALGATSSGLAYISYFELIRRIGATRTLTVTYLQPVVAIALGVAILGERLEAVHLAGLALVLLGVAIIHARAMRAAGSEVRLEPH